MRRKIAIASGLVDFLEEKGDINKNPYDDDFYGLKFKGTEEDDNDAEVIINFLIGQQLTIYIQKIYFSGKGKFIYLSVRILEDLKKIAKMKP